ncbi:hypothetical protein C095_04375 [Fusobacterium necrophorum subsp. funduliforme B35]|uniref:Uncharacterized protein n=1 Tax=Fusobacterium necrophorum subsp. funduliforme B35 TaxID=1226633 RepID=A0A0B4EWT7_9FUSO|nr:hypothetical protein C095_04375 [Fusobacterium necrophorum subsp. funduliforme B35]
MEVSYWEIEKERTILFLERVKDKIYHRGG